tara:strand:+ start:116 stop:661 length:546 start_codon:yes stop_codon:yes gene_type:complete
MKLKYIKSVTVYCSSSNKIDKSYFNIAKKLGVYLAQKKINLIYGGGSNGLMGAISESVVSNKGYVIGIIPSFLKTKENINYNLNKLVVVNTMAKRKKLLFDKGDAFIVLPGGIGTLEELSETTSWLNLGLHKKPIIIFNYKNFWDPLIKMLKKMNNKKFLDKNYNKIIYLVKNISDLKKIL